MTNGRAGGGLHARKRIKTGRVKSGRVIGTVLFATVLIAMVAACSDDSSRSTDGSTAGHGTAPGQPAAPAPVTTTEIDPLLELEPTTTVAEHLDVPWGVAFFPNGDALVSERDSARLLRVTQAGEVSVLAEVADVTPTAEGGLLGVAVSPTYEQDHLIYAFATTADEERVLRGTIEQFADNAEDAILTGIPRGEIHDGGRLAFGPDGKLYVTTGETGDGELAQAKSSLGGKILRLEPDGSIPDDNPFPNSPIWSYGHRNVQGIAWDDAGRLWATEYGSTEWDEVNLIRRGHNYGWPSAEGTSDLPGVTNPAAVFSTDVASPSGLAYLDGALWFGALQGQTMWRLPVRSNGTLGKPTAVKLAEARIRTAGTTPDGSGLWVTTSNRDGRATPRANDDYILQYTP
jgi:glucose/arabinose dehydrogenase